MKPSDPKANKNKEMPEKTGNKLGFRAKKNKHGISKSIEASKSQEKQKDIYEFDDSEEMEPNEIKSPMRNRTNKLSEEKIVIPERPFKDIGLDEQHGIKFHKPEEVNNQKEESLMSSTSYSDRDDFNYGSMSDNEEINQDDEGNSNSESNSSAQVAKGIETKFVIMGRIFKNATIDRLECEEDDKKTLEQKKKLPTQELNKLFDSLREDNKESEDMEPSQPAETRESISTTINPIPSNNSGNRKVSDKSHEVLNTDLKKRSPKQNNIDDCKLKELNIGDRKLEKSECTLEQQDNENKEKREIKRRSRKDASQQYSKEIYKLQSELGMSAEEIANLINEGKRKSQRRCAANRPQKFVETWSSDEYEDFLSTKDIIAFIEEKEKKSRKRKSTSRTNEKRKLIEASNVKLESNPITCTSGKGEKETTSGAISNLSEISSKKREKIVDKLLEKISNSQKDTLNDGENKSESIQFSDDSFNKLDKEKRLPVPKTMENNSQKKPTLSAKPRLKIKAADSESDFETEWRRSRSKIKKRRKTISFKERDNGKRISKPADTRRRLATKSNKANNCRRNSGLKNYISTETIRPLARRKRVASEMLYYWSSSSDEEFGRIETRDDDDDISPEGEHYQQHGWIVGDSHKKLVTLLATAKAKKVEEGIVKETGNKKK